ncbi:alpha/beta-hydrolase [Heliocybe sulcata]|uniref:Alpha/beta-hydrolase n=1 Tax=Heliocybe sulcata TaxID=5364 RepID=A0A5C3NA86_9AGAM|nr:alpha/beta-hydrolase [Heliocybe sulcata]
MVLFNYSVLPRPIKTLFIPCYLLFLGFVQTPILLVVHALPFMRPKRGWGLARTVRVKTWRTSVFVSRTFGKIMVFPDHRALAPGQNGLWIDPVPESLIVGRIKDMAAKAGVGPVKLPGYWVDKSGAVVPIGAPPRAGEKVVLHLHGGSYSFLSATPKDVTRHVGLELLKRCPSIGRVFSIEYRLTTTPDNQPAYPFPTQLIDALTGYYYLVNTVGFSPADIILDGDSAGGNLALALTLYLVENRNHESLNIPPPPGRLLLLSPWTDLSRIPTTPSSSWSRLAGIDYLHPGDIQDKAELFCGPFGLDEAAVNPYISPASTHPSLSVSFRGFPRTFILCGGSEMLRDQIHVLRDNMVKDMGDGNVVYYEPPDAVHDFLAVGMSWMEPEWTDSWNEIVKWLGQ